jgi:hypothetical protein
MFGLQFDGTAKGGIPYFNYYIMMWVLSSLPPLAIKMH